MYVYIYIQIYVYILLGYWKILIQILKPQLVIYVCICACMHACMYVCGTPKEPQNPEP